MTYLITGATGFIGSHLIHKLLADGHAVHYLARKRSERLPTQASFNYWNQTENAPLTSVPRVDAIVHLSGEPVAQPWTKKAKHRIYESRVNGTRNLIASLSTLRHKPEVLVSASAIGYYGDCGNEIVNEANPAGFGFLADVCVAWEKEAQKARDFGLRVVRVRFGTVLGMQGGALPKMLTPAKLGLGATFGNGRQWMSWIHIDDLVNLLLFASNRVAATEALNGTSLEPVTNEEFTKTLGRVLHRPAFLQAPKIILRLLLGEMSQMLLSSARVQPQAVIRAGFRFCYPVLAEALRDLLERRK